MHFKILKMAFRVQTVPECTRFFFGHGFAPDPTAELTAFPTPSNWSKGTLLLRRRRGGGREEGEGGGTKVKTPRPSVSAYAPALDPSLSVLF